MEEVIKEIKRAEENAALLIEAAQKEAAEIVKSLDAQLEALKDEYEQKLNDDSAKVFAAAKARINKLRTEEGERAVVQADKLRSEVSAKIKPCADFVYDFIIKEFAQ
ncbi:MAG: hypothetical protein J1F36_06380 [Clostridiales bacterium]|nr:hypothetical protein [Clostridiales bacterium]